MTGILKFVFAVIVCIVLAVTMVFMGALAELHQRVDLLINHTGFWYTDEDGVVRDIRKPRTEGLQRPEFAPHRPAKAPMV